MSDQPERCPRCDSTDRLILKHGICETGCYDPWHTSAPPEPTAASQATPSAKQFYPENAALVERVFDTFDTKGKSTLYVDRDLLVQVLSIKDKNAASQVYAAIKGTTQSAEQFKHKLAVCKENGSRWIQCEVAEIEAYAASQNAELRAELERLRAALEDIERIAHKPSVPKRTIRERAEAALRGEAKGDSNSAETPEKGGAN